MSPYRVSAWEWAEFPIDDHATCLLGNEALIDFRSALSLSTVNPSSDAVQQLVKLMRVAGYFERLQLLSYRFTNHYLALRQAYALSDDGIAVVNISPPFDYVHRLTSLFADFVASGKRLTDRMDGILKKLFGEGSERYVMWKKSAADLFDDDLGYAVLQELRNEMEHGFAFVTVVNYDPGTHEAALAINIESGLLIGDKLKATTRNRVREYRNRQLERGFPPFLKVGGMVDTYRIEVYALYLDCLAHLKSAYESNALSNRVKKELEGYNCIYWRAEESSTDGYAIDRIYPLPKPDDLEALLDEAGRIAATLPSIS